MIITSLSKKLRKAVDFLSVIFILTLILMALFPKFFINAHNKDKGLVLLPPSRGINKLTIKNSTTSPIQIQKIALKIGKTKEHIINILNKEEINSNESIVRKFIIKEIKQSDYRDVRIIIYSTEPGLNEKIALTMNDGIELSNDIVENKENEFFYPIPIKNLTMYDYNKPKERILVRYPLGTDEKGYDLWNKIVLGTRIVLKIALFSTLIAIPIALFIGFVRGYFEGVFTDALTKIIDVISNLPLFLVIMALAPIFGQKDYVIIMVFGLLLWLELERVIYDKVNFLKKQDFVVSAKTFGKTNFNIMYSEILPFVFPYMIINIISIFSKTILLESSLSYIGYSVAGDISSWGKLLSQAEHHFFSLRALWLSLSPMFMIIATLLSISHLRKIMERRLKYA